VRESAENGLKFHRPVRVPVSRRSWRHPLEQPLHAGGFWRHEPADGDLGTRHGGAIAGQLAAIFQHTGKDQVGCAVSTVVRPQRGQVLEHQIVVPCARRRPLPHQRVEIDRSVGHLQGSQNVVDLCGHRGFANTCGTGDEQGRN
jgi:hypothetical protein